MSDNEKKELITIDEMYGNKQVALSNSLIQAREKTSLLESKIELLAVYKLGTDIKARTKRDAAGNAYEVHYVTVHSSEIRTLADKKGGSIYQQVEDVALELKKKVIIMRDERNNQFLMKSLYGDVAYDRGTLMIEFEPSTESEFLEMSSNFTRLPLQICFKFTTNGGFQLYKLLKSYAFNLPKIDLDLEQEELPCIEKQYTLSEIRLQLGYVDLNQEDIRKEASKKIPDADRMVALEKKPKYKRFTDFNARVLIPGIREINRMSDIYIAGIEKFCSGHGKVDGIIIRVQHNRQFYLNKETEKGNIRSTEQEKPKKLSEEEAMMFWMKMGQIIQEDLSMKDLKAIGKAANYNLDRIRKAYELLKTQTKPVDNMVGWMITAIREEYTAVKKTAASGSVSGTENGSSDRAFAGSSKGSGRKNSFHNFSERTYDYDELARKLAEKNREKYSQTAEQDSM